MGLDLQTTPLAVSFEESHKGPNVSFRFFRYLLALFTLIRG